MFSFSGNSAIIIFACELNYIFLSTERAAVSIVGISLRQKAISRRYEINIISISQFPVITIPYARNCRLDMTAAFWKLKLGWKYVFYYWQFLALSHKIKNFPIKLYIIAILVWLQDWKTDNS